MSLPITLATGETVNLPLNQNTHFIIRLVDPADIPNPDFENTSFPNYQTTSLKSVTTVDVQTDTVTITVAPTGDLTKYTDQDWANLLLTEFNRIMLGADLSQANWKDKRVKIMLSEVLNKDAIMGLGPLFKISYPPLPSLTPTP